VPIYSKEVLPAKELQKKYQEREEVHRQKPEVEASRCASEKMNSPTSSSPS
jgi:hypothetical protein